MISIVDADTFWVDAYFEETQLASVREGDPAEIKLMGYNRQTVLPRSAPEFARQSQPAKFRFPDHEMERPKQGLSAFR